MLMVALITVGILGWSLRFRAPLVVDVQALASLPQQIGGWSAIEAPLDRAVEEELGADLNLQRAYFGPADAPIWLYIGYYGTDRGGRPKHSPRGCYPGAGWGIEQTRVLEVSPARQLRANEYLLSREADRRLVLFWYRSHRSSSMLGGLDQNLDRMVGRLRDGRSDGALVRVSTPILRDDEIQARGRLLAFASQLDALLDQHWPDEQPGP